MAAYPAVGQGTLRVPRVVLYDEIQSTRLTVLSTQDIVKRSREKSELLKGYGDTVLRAEALEKEFDKSKKHSALLQSKLDSTFTQYHNKVQDMQAKRDDLIKKNKTLQQKNKGMPSTTVLEYLLCCLSIV